MSAAPPLPPPTVPAPSGIAALRQRLTEALRDPNPILVRELRAIFRTSLFIRFLYVATAFVGVVVVAGGAIAAAGPLAPGDVGEIVFQTFFATALLVTALVAPGYAATTITGERESRTYESLLLSGMSPGRIVWGKFVAAYASFTLVLVALAPVVGVAFLFGGISPWHVVTGYVGLLYVLATAIAAGVAVSARLPSTRVAIVVAAPLSFGAAIVGTSTLAGLGELARDVWGTGMAGPFWFTDAIVVRFGEWDTFGLLVVLPTYLVVMVTWFFLATSVAAVQPAAEDRSTQLKVWSIVAVAGVWAIAAGVLALISRPDDRATAGLVVAGVGMAGTVALALLFSDEPPLPPRVAPAHSEAPAHIGAPARARPLAALLGPGAAPTLRFTAVVVVALAAGATLVPAAMRHALDRRFAEHWRFDVALMTIFLGGVASTLFIASLAAWLRIVLRSGLAARVLALCVWVVLLVLPLLAQLVVSPGSLVELDESVPLLARLSPLAPLFVAAGLAGKHLTAGAAFAAIAPLGLYALGAAVLWALTERRVVGIRAEVEARRARQAARAAQADAARAGSAGRGAAETAQGEGDAA